MKILFVGRNSQVGGGATFRLRASLGLIGRGHQISLAAAGGALDGRFSDAGVRLFKTLPTPFNRLQLAAMLRKNRFDVVHACGCTAGDDLAWAIAKLGRDAPAWVMSVHGNLPDYVTGNRCLREAAEIMTFDQSALDRLNRIDGMRPDVFLMPRPVEKRDLQAAPSSPPHLVMVSRLSKTKGPAALAAIDAVESLEARFPGLALTIFGEGSAREGVAARGAALNEKLGREAVKVPGSVTDPFVAMQSAAAVIGTSYVALEALFHAIPVVAAGYEGYGAIEELNLDEAVACNFGDGFPGVQPRVTAEWLSPRLERVLTHFSTPEGRAELKRMRARLEQNHSLDAVAARLETIYRRAIEAREITSRKSADRQGASPKNAKSNAKSNRKSEAK